MPSSVMVLVTCTGMLFSGGVILGMSTSWNLARMSYLFWTSDAGSELGAAVLFVAGSILCLPICWITSLVPAYPRSQPLIGSLMVLSSGALVLLSLGLSSMSALSQLVRDYRALNASMYRAMSKAPIHMQTRNSFAAMQLEMQCCGIQSANDWNEYSLYFPPSCCNRKLKSKTDDDYCLIPEFERGCLGPALIELRNFINSCSIISSVLIVVLGLTLVVAAYMIVTGAERAEQRACKMTAGHMARLLYAPPPPPGPPCPPYPAPPPPLPLPLHHGTIQV